MHAIKYSLLKNEVLQQWKQDTKYVHIMRHKVLDRVTIVMTETDTHKQTSTKLTPCLDSSTSC